MACFQWREDISFKRSSGPEQPVNTDWYMSRALAETLGLYLLSDGQWAFAASGIDASGNSVFQVRDIFIGAMTGNVLEWTDENHAEQYPFGLYGGYFSGRVQGYFRVNSRDGLSRGDNIGVRFGRDVPRI